MSNQCCDPGKVTDTTAYGWLCEAHDHCTCGAGGPEGHEPMCGLIPIEPLK